MAGFTPRVGASHEANTWSMEPSEHEPQPRSWRSWGNTRASTYPRMLAQGPRYPPNIPISPPSPTQPPPTTSFPRHPPPPPLFDKEQTKPVESVEYNESGMWRSGQVIESCIVMQSQWLADELLRPVGCGSVPSPASNHHCGQRGNQPPEAFTMPLSSSSPIL